MPRHQRSADALLGAARVRAEEGGPSPFAATLEAQTRVKLEPRELVPVPGGEVLPAQDDAAETPLALRDTLRSPDVVAADASRDRLDLAQRAGALALAVDAADSVGARDSLERMLAHQLAAAHAGAMRMADVMHQQMEIAAQTRGSALREANVEACRTANAVARLMGAYQAGLVTLQRLRSGGEQRVLVQYTQVQDGGQAVVAGSVAGAGGRRRGRRGAR